MYENLKERIEWIMDNYHVSLSDISRAADVRPSSVFCWLNGQTKTMSAPVAYRLSAHFRIPFAWIVNGGVPDPQWVTLMVNGEPFDPIYNDDVRVSESYITVPLYRVPFGAGIESSDVSPDETEPIPIPVKKVWLREHGIKPDKICLITVSGDSMQPLIYDNDYVLVDTNETEIRSGKVYAFEINETLRVKRLYISLKGDLTIKSDNPAYGDELFSKDDTTNYIRILGRVLYRFGAGDL